MKGRPILGAISGVALGVFLAIDLQQFGIRPLDDLSVIGLPVLGMVIGVLVAAVAPFGSKTKQ